jgi:hypothetical protein
MFPWGLFALSATADKRQINSFSMQSKALAVFWSASPGPLQNPWGCSIWLWNMPTALPRSCQCHKQPHVQRITQAVPPPLFVWEGQWSPQCCKVWSCCHRKGGTTTGLYTLQRELAISAVRRGDGIWAAVCEVTWSCHLRQTSLLPNLGLTWAVEHVTWSHH